MKLYPSPNRLSLLIAVLLAMPAAAQTVDPVQLLQFALYWKQTDVNLGMTTADFTPIELLCLLAGGCETDPEPSRIWYVDNSRPNNGDGSLANPFNTVDPVNGLSGEGDVDGSGEAIFLFQGSTPYNAGLDLEANQFLFGQGVDLRIGGQTLVAGSAAQAPILDNTGVISNVVDLADQCLVRGVRIRVNRTTGIFGSRISRAVIRDVSITGSGGDPAGIDIRNASEGLFLIQNTWVSDTGRGISLRQCAGTFSILDSTLVDTSDPTLGINGGTCDVLVAGQALLRRVTAAPISVSNGHTGLLSVGPGVQVQGNSLGFSNADGTYLLDAPVRLQGIRSRLTITSGSQGTFTFNDLSIHALVSDPQTFPTAMVLLGSSTATVEINQATLVQEGPNPVFETNLGDNSHITFAGGSATRITATDGTLLKLGGSKGVYRFEGRIDSMGADHGIDLLEGFEGTVELAEAFIADPTGSVIRASGGGGEIHYRGGAITAGVPATVVDIQEHQGLIELSPSVTVSAATGEGFRFQQADGTYRFSGEVTLEGGNSGIGILDSDGQFTFRKATVHNNAGGEGINIDGTVTKALSEIFASDQLPPNWFRATIIDGSDSFTNLWHVSSARSADALAGHSPPYCLYYGENESAQAGGDFDTGDRNGGLVITPGFVVPSLNARLRLNYFRDTEDTLSDTNRVPDISIVELSNNATSSPILGSFNGTIVNTEGQWMQAEYDLSPFAGNTYTLGFRFESRDELNNDGEGWMIDDVEVVGSGSAIADVTFEELNLTTQGGTGFRIHQAGTVLVGSAVPAEIESVGAPGLDLQNLSGSLRFASIGSTGAFSPGIESTDLNGFLSVAGGTIAAASQGVSAVRVTQNATAEVCLHLAQMNLMGSGEADDIVLLQSGSGTLAITQASLAALATANGGVAVGTTGTLVFGCTEP